MAERDSSYVRLQSSQDAFDLIHSHRQVQEYWSEYKVEIAKHFDFLRGRQWDAEELLVFSQKKKAPVVFNQLKPAERTVLGLFIQNRYDVKFAPFEPNDQDLSDIWQQLYLWTNHEQEWAFKDIEVFRQAWACGSAYQEVYVDVRPGREPSIRTQNLNVFAVYWDPESRDLITRSDARFVDRVTWMNVMDLSDKYPDKVTQADIDSMQVENDEKNTFEKTTIYRDRSHESYDRKNGKVKVIERLYLVKEKVFYTLDQEMRRQDIPKNRVRAFKAAFPEREVYEEDQNMLYLAMACPAWNQHDFLYNDEYHCQPRDEATGDILWPILEMVAESLNGDPNGFVEPQVSPSKIVNSTMANVHHATKHAASTSYLRKHGAFINEKEAKLADKHHSDGDRVFKVRDDVDIGNVFVPIKKGETNSDHDKALNFALSHLKEVSSTPPALQGQQESASTSGILNAQRIEQAFVQLQVLIANWKQFLRRRAKLIQFYIRQYYSFEKSFRIVEKDDPATPDFVTINQQVPEQDPLGELTGNLQKLNDISAVRYDLIIEDSYRSPTFRAKTQAAISELMQTPAVQGDPVLMGMLFLEFARLSDMSQELKDFIREHSSTLRQKSAEAQAMQQNQAVMDQMQQMQGIAQTEAEQAGGAGAGPPPGGPQGGEVPQGVPPSAQESLQQRPTAFAPPAAAMEMQDA